MDEPASGETEFASSPPPELPKLRIFVSSPGDVGAERGIARIVIERFRQQWRGRLALDSYFWEDKPMMMLQAFQEQIPPKADFDVVIAILWGRLGTPLVGPDGREYGSGTEYEVESARESFERTGRPVLLLYRNQTAVPIPGAPDAQSGEAIRQLEAVNGFIARYCVNPVDSTVTGAFTGYNDLAAFEALLETHLQEFVTTHCRRLGLAASGGNLRTAAVWPGCPYQGLRYFDVAQAPVFFGRTRAIGEVIALLRRQVDLVTGTPDNEEPALRKMPESSAVFVLVTAPSGAGKSSLVRAGVLPVMTQQGAGIDLWRRVILSPGEMSPDEELFAAFVRALLQPEGVPELGDGVTSEELAETIRGDLRSFTVMLKQALGRVSTDAHRDKTAHLNSLEASYRQQGRINDAKLVAKQREQLKLPAVRLALVIDQMEELFLLPQISEATRAAFAEMLARLARGGHVWVIGTLRNDFLRDFDKVPVLRALRAQRTWELQPPDATELGQMIRQPAQAAGLSFDRQPGTDAALDEVLRDEAARNPQALPCLEFVLEKLWVRQDENGLLSFAAYDEIGGLDGVLATTADEVLRDIESWSEATFAQVFGNLVTLGTAPDKLDVHRRVANYDRLTSQPEAKALVDAFVKARLFFTDQDLSGQPIVAVAHEALLARRTPAERESAPGNDPPASALAERAAGKWQWPKLGAWVEANQDALRVREQVSEAMQRWLEAGKKDHSLLLAGPRLQAGLRLLRERPHLFSHAEADYALESVRAWRKMWIRRAVVGALGVLIVALAVLVGWRSWSSARAQQRESARADLDAARNQAAKEDWKGAVASLGRAVTKDPWNRAAAGWLWSELVYGKGTRDFPPQLRLEHGGGGIASAVCSSNGQRIVSAGHDHLAWQWDIASGQHFGPPLRHAGRVTGAAYNFNGTRILTICEDRKVRQWNASDGKLIDDPVPESSDMQCAAWSPDGSRIVIGGDDNSVRQLDAATGAPVGKPMLHKNSVLGVAWSPDGTRIVTASADDTAQQWDAKSGEQVGPPMSHARAVTRVVYSPDGTRIATASDQFVEQWDASTSQSLGIKITLDGVASDVAYRPDGLRLVTAGANHLGRQWDAATGQPSGEPLDHAKFVASVTWTPDGRQIVTACTDGFVRCWPANQGSGLGEPLRGGSKAREASYSQDGRRIVAPCTDHQVRQWDATTGELTGPAISLPGDVQIAVFNPDRSRIVTACGLLSVQQWDAVSGQPLGPAMLHPGGVTSAAWSPDGTRIVTACTDKMVRQWDAKTGNLIGVPLSYNGIVLDARYSPDSIRLLTCDMEDGVRQTDVATGNRTGSILPAGRDGGVAGGLEPRWQPFSGGLRRRDRPAVAGCGRRPGNRSSAAASRARLASGLLSGWHPDRHRRRRSPHSPMGRGNWPARGRTAPIGRPGKKRLLQPGRDAHSRWKPAMGMHGSRRSRAGVVR